MASLSIFRSLTIKVFVNFGFLLRFSWVDVAWRIFASRAELKSKENICISFLIDLSIILKIHSKIPFSTNIFIVSSLILIFYRIATQNLWLTLPSSISSSFKISIILTISIGSFVTKYSTPLRVETITDINAKSACLKHLLVISNNSSKN